MAPLHASQRTPSPSTLTTINYQKELPFFNVTNPQLIQLVESTHKAIKSMIENSSFNSHIQSSLPKSAIIKKDIDTMK